MNRQLLSFFITLICTSGFCQTTVFPSYLEKWNNSKNYLLEVAEAMPEDYYGFKPTEQQQSFKEQLIHIQENMNWLSFTYLINDPERLQAGKQHPDDSKEEIISWLKKSFENSSEVVRQLQTSSLYDTVQFFNGPKNKYQILTLMQDHVTHHRGQLMVYLHLKGIATPKYTGW